MKILLFNLVSFLLLISCQTEREPPPVTNTNQPADTTQSEQQPDTLTNVALKLQQEVLESKADEEIPVKLDTLVLRPNEHPDIPEEIAVWLENRNYLVPILKNIGSEDYMNALHGEFIEAGQKDFVVLASDKAFRRLVVFPNMDTLAAEIILKDPATHDWEIYHAKNIVFKYGSISEVDKEFIIDQYEYFGGPEPPEITHKAINYTPYETSSVVFYCHRGEWLQLQGAD